MESECKHVQSYGISSNTAVGTPLFSGKPSAQGRLTMIRKLGLIPRPRRVVTERTQVLARKHLVEVEWGPFFQQSRCDCGLDRIYFPALEILILDFTDWALAEDERIAVSHRFRLSQAASNTYHVHSHL